MQKIAILYDASQAVISTFDLDEVLSQILSILRDYFHLHRVAVVLLDADTNMLHVRSHTGWNRESQEMELPLGKGLIGTAAKLKRPIYAPKVSNDPRYIMSIPSTRSELAVPLIVRDEVVGVLDCQSDQEEFFDTETIDLLTLFSTQASIALQNAKLYSNEQRKAAQLEAINAIARQTTAVLDFGELLQKSCHFILQSFAVDHVAVLLLEDGMLVLRAHEGRLTPRIQLGSELQPAAGLCARVIASGKPVTENDVSRVEGYVAGFEETRSEMCLPLISLGETLGVLTMESAQTNAFSPADAQPLESVADICAAAIQNARYFEKVSQLAYVDGLTGIFNRRYFEKRIAEEIERAQRYENELSVIMIDIDNFKKLNDEFGHLLGDETLRQVSTIFAQNLRKVDIACRYGGEEFVIVAPQTSGEHAQAVAEKLRKVVEGWSFPGVPRPVTITAGVCSFPANGRTRDELVKAADDALYLAKQGGRNRVHLAGSGLATTA
ncbi:MAG TPA: diguanylate cyclase [Terriglobales bacterium]